MIFKGTFALTLLITLALVYTLISRQWAAAVPLALSSAMLFYFSRLFLRYQTGSAGTLSADRIVIQPNTPSGDLYHRPFLSGARGVQHGPCATGRARRAERGGLAGGPGWHAQHRAGAY